jgi:hypothetical protein
MNSGYSKAKITPASLSLGFQCGNNLAVAGTGSTVSSAPQGGKRFFSKRIPNGLQASRT